MKKLAFFLLFSCMYLQLSAQNQIDTYIKEAQGYLVKKDYKQAQLSLQDALNEINNLLAKQVGDLFPAEINGLKADGDAETSAAAMGMMGGGMQISKKYRNDATKQDAEIQIMANSPLLASLNMFLTNPSMMGKEYKSARVGSNRAILKSEMEDGDNGKKIRSTEIQLPLGQTLILIHTNGFATEQDELAFANKLDLEKIRAALGN
jgi:hypothetical protein